MRVVLIFPPATDPRAPQLALPSLAAALRRAGVETEVMDLNLSGLLAVVQPERLVAAGRRLVAQRAQEQLGRCAEHLASAIPGALQTLRDPQRFLDPAEYNAARQVLLNAAELVSAAAERPVSYGLVPVRYDIEGCDPSRLSDLVAATGDRRTNLFADYYEEVVFADLDRRRPDVIGITITNRQQILPGLTLARELRQRGHFVVLGGAVYTKFVAELGRVPQFFEVFADGVVVYEGETALVALCAELAGARRFEQVPNFLFRDGDAVKATPHHVEDVDSLPTPDFAGLPLGDYLAPAPVLPILTGKGCYFNRCKFCDIPYINHISRKAYRIRSPERIVADVRSLQDRHEVKHFLITDEALSPRLLLELADAFAPYLHEERHFTGYARLEPGFTPQVCERIAAIGMRKLFFGLESGSQVMLDHMDKGIKVAQAPAVLRSCRDAGIHFHLFSIIGFPEESETSARETMAFFADNTEIIDAPGNSFDIHPYGLELRTPYFENAADSGIVIHPGALTRNFIIGLSEKDWQNTRGLGTERVHELLSKEFYPVLRKLYKRYHNCPLHLWPAFEEYALLYADHYRDHAFAGRTCLPDLDDPRPVHLRWNPAAWVEEAGNRVRLYLGLEHVELVRDNYQLLGGGGPRTISQILDEATGGSTLGRSRFYDRLREYIDALIGKGLLQVTLVEQRSSRAA